ncbi:MAG: hypothetical protein BWZ08_02392 [candidate division BRC1 bacterium ADurb.BinA292]|nr:MAG: hypothetical protein BWZ08_02392 [candidate division BRC1 bacterium ADurb.BinA292]
MPAGDPLAQGRAPQQLLKCVLISEQRVGHRRAGDELV